MTDILELDFNVEGQTLYFDVPEGRPTSVQDVSVWEDTDGDDVTEEDALGPPSIDSVNTTFDADSGPEESDPTLCNLTATTNIVIGRRYLATNAAGETEWIEVERITSGASVSHRSHLANQYALGDTFKGTRISAVVDSDWIADEDNISNPRCPKPRWRFVVSYTVAGVEYRAAVFFGVTRYPFRLTVSALDVDRLSRGWLSRLHPDDVRGAGNEILKEAAKQVRFDLWEHELTDSGFRNNEIINELIRWRAVWLIADAALFQGAGNPTQVELASTRYFERFDKLVRQPKSRVQATEEGAAAVHKRSLIWER